MIVMKKDKEKTPYSLLSNIRYIYTILFHNRPIMWFSVIATIILSVTLPLISNFIPAAAVDSIIKQNNAMGFVTRMVLILMTFGLLTFLQKYISTWSDFYIDQTQNKDFLLKLVLKSLKMYLF